MLFLLYWNVKIIKFLDKIESFLKFWEVDIIKYTQSWLQTFGSQK